MPTPLGTLKYLRSLVWCLDDFSSSRHQSKLREYYFCVLNGVAIGSLGMEVQEPPNPPPPPPVAPPPPGQPPRRTPRVQPSEDVAGPPLVAGSSAKPAKSSAETWLRLKFKYKEEIHAWELLHIRQGLNYWTRSEAGCCASHC